MLGRFVKLIIIVACALVGTVLLFGILGAVLHAVSVLIRLAALAALVVGVLYLSGVLTNTRARGRW